MKTPFAALVWDRVLPLQDLDRAAILAFYQQWGEQLNPELTPAWLRPPEPESRARVRARARRRARAASPSASPSESPSASPSASPAASASPS